MATVTSSSPGLGRVRQSDLPTVTVPSQRYPAVGDGTTDDTVVMQAALTAATGGVLHIKKPTTKYLVGALNVLADTSIVIAPGTILESNATLLTGTTRLLNIAVENVYIRGYGATIQMVKAGFSSEHNHGVHVSAASGDIVIEGLTSNDSGGDGFYVKSPLAHVVFRDCKADNNRRQGCSVVECLSYTEHDCRWTGTTGTAPSAGLDIEPNDTADILGPIRIYNPICTGNDGPGIEIFLNNWRAVTNYADIEIHNAKTADNGNVSVGGRKHPGIDINRMSSTTPCRGRIKIVSPVCVDENCAGIHVYDWDAAGPLVEIDDATVINPNQEQLGASQINGGIILYNSSSYTTAMGNIRVTRPVIRDDDGFLNAGSVAPMRLGGIVTAEIRDPVVAYAGSTMISSDVNATPIITKQVEDPIAQTGNVTMTDWRYVGRVLTNDGASGLTTRTLPVSKVGIVLTISLMESFECRVIPNAADRIVPTGGDVGKYITSSVRGSRVRLVCREAGFWNMESIVGTWASEA